MDETINCSVYAFPGTNVEKTNRLFKCRKIINRVAKHYKVRRSTLYEPPVKHSQKSEPKMIASAILNITELMTYAEISSEFGYKNTSSVSNCKIVFSDMYNYNPKLKRKIESMLDFVLSDETDRQRVLNYLIFSKNRNKYERVAYEPDNN